MILFLFLKKFFSSYNQEQTSKLGINSERNYYERLEINIEKNPVFVNLNRIPRGYTITVIPRLTRKEKRALYASRQRSLQKEKALKAPIVKLTEKELQERIKELKLNPNFHKPIKNEENPFTYKHKVTKWIRKQRKFFYDEIENSVICQIYKKACEFFQEKHPKKAILFLIYSCFITDVYKKDVKKFFNYSHEVFNFENVIKVFDQENLEKVKDMEYFLKSSYNTILEGYSILEKLKRNNEKIKASQIYEYEFELNMLEGLYFIFN
ncbi:hypothetical protein TUBRATIS_19190 [Tubulinosema ratisbonensis]|uniref:Uncharacterized protein n=1 Tax=Tubulinosema ratisbonensis TaxID=291195 RepID=A0A437AKJ6_9MICR|nr:hypothetical protein TUBRATIS_19190 [Tubulinosema ratisbonensis]